MGEDLKSDCTHFVWYIMRNKNWLYCCNCGFKLREFIVVPETRWDLSIQWRYAFNWFYHLNFMPKNVIQWTRNSMEIKKCNWELEFIDFCSVSSPFSFKYQDNSLALNYLSFLELNSVTWWMFWISKPWGWGTWEKHWFINSCPKKS